MLKDGGIIEVKAGNGKLSTNQFKLQADSADGKDVKAVGRRAGEAGLSGGDKKSPGFFSLEGWK